MASNNKQVITKHAEFLTNLRSMVMKNKEGELAQTDIKGLPGGDPKSEKMPDSTETTDKNGVGADKNKPQDYGQKPSSNEGEPLKGSKKASVEELAASVISDVEKAASENKKAELAQTDIKGLPGGDPKSEKMPDSTETTDKNGVGADKNKPQDYGQKPSSNESEPLKGSKKAEVEEMASKVASYQLGRQFAAALLKQAAFSQTSNNDLLKEAGRRDFEDMIAQAGEELQPQYAEAEVLKHAADAGSSYFDDIMAKKASAEAPEVVENKELKAKLAELEAKLAASTEVTTSIKSTIDKEAAAKAKEAADAEFIAKVAAAAAALVENKLKSEAASK